MVGTSRRNLKLAWTQPEVDVILEWKGKITPDELLIKVNQVSKVKRSKSGLARKAAAHGWKLKKEV